MDTIFLLRGCIIGLAVAAPIGPNGVLCIRRTLAYGRRAGLVSGLGATTVHTLYATLAACGLAVVANTLSGTGLWLHALGGGFLCYLGLKTFLARPAGDAARGEGSLRAIYASTMLLTLTNPFTILSFSALISGFGLVAGTGSVSATAILVLGVALGSGAWWCILSGGTSLLRAFVTAHRLSWVNRASGAAIGVFGVLAIASAAW